MWSHAFGFGGVIWIPSRVNGLVSIRDEFFIVLLFASPAFGPNNAPELFVGFVLGDVDLAALAAVEILHCGSWGEEGWPPCSGIFA